MTWKMFPGIVFRKISLVENVRISAAVETNWTRWEVQKEMGVEVVSREIKWRTKWKRQIFWVKDNIILLVTQVQYLWFISESSLLASIFNQLLSHYSFCLYNVFDIHLPFSSTVITLIIQMPISFYLELTMIFLPLVLYPSAMGLNYVSPKCICWSPKQCDYILR